MEDTGNDGPFHLEGVEVDELITGDKPLGIDAPGIGAARNPAPDPLLIILVLQGGRLGIDG